MKNTFGQSVCVTLFGESHGPSVGVVLDGLPAGIPVDEAEMHTFLSRRRPMGAISTARSEADEFIIESGVYRGFTNGAPLCIRIPNQDVRSQDYDHNEYKARPGHADFTARCKHRGYEDPRGGGHFSGRLTAALVAAGGILIPALERKGIRIGTHICRLNGVADRSFDDTVSDFEALKRAEFPVLDAAVADAIKERIVAAKTASDSVGGVLETAVVGMPVGVGEPWFDTVEGVLSHALFSIPAIKGVEFGEGFAMAELLGSTANDPFRVDENGRVVTLTNHNGGVLGGLTTGMPITFRCAVKPTPTISKEQQTVSLTSGVNTTITAIGRHDPCIVHRAAVVVDSVTALVLCDLLSGRFGTDWLVSP